MGATGLEHSLELSALLPILDAGEAKCEAVRVDALAAELVRQLSEAECQRLAELLLDSAAATGRQSAPRLQ